MCPSSRQHGARVRLPQSPNGRRTLAPFWRQEAQAQVYLEHYLRNVLILSETLRGFMLSPPLDHIVFGITAVAHRLYQSIH